ncbi:MAG TPA: hypothetical protein VE818_08370 [Nitrososphaeraceae archaeon]|nr:hypothetical protein [Nitrososphaeraceae archaeon]
MAFIPLQTRRNRTSSEDIAYDLYFLGLSFKMQVKHYHQELQKGVCFNMKRGAKISTQKN